MSLRSVVRFISTLFWLWGTHAALNNQDAIPPGMLSGLWWGLATSSLIGAMRWDYRLNEARLGRPLGWLWEYLIGLFIVLLLVQHHWYFTSIAVLVMMMLDELIYSTNPAEWETTDKENGNT